MGVETTESGGPCILYQHQQSSAFLECPSASKSVSIHSIDMGAQKLPSRREAAYNPSNIAYRY